MARAAVVIFATLGYNNIVKQISSVFQVDLIN